MNGNAAKGRQAVSATIDLQVKATDTTVTFMVPGRPIPQRRPRVTATHTYNERNEWRESIQWVASQHFKGWPLDKRYRIDVLMKTDSMRGDIDNFGKAIMDALQGHAYKNDNQVDDFRIRREKGDPQTSLTVSVI